LHLPYKFNSLTPLTPTFYQSVYNREFYVILHKQFTEDYNMVTNRDEDLNYDFDAVGNIIQQTDNAQTIQYFGNQQIAPVSTYEYDALYRLTKATGRELANLTAPTHNDFPNNIPCPAIVPANLIRRYMH
jgi:hypothetical protein